MAKEIDTYNRKSWLLRHLSHRPSWDLAIKAIDIQQQGKASSNKTHVYWVEESIG